MGAFDEVPPIRLPDDSNPEAAKAFRKKWRWDEHESVLLKSYATVADQEYVHDLAMTSDKKGEIIMHSSQFRYAMLDRLILDWNLLRNGTKMPLSKESIRKLPSNYSLPILERIDALAGEMKEEEQQAFLTSPNGHITGSYVEGSLHQKKS
jgi:hypothetical protein